MFYNSYLAQNKNYKSGRIIIKVPPADGSGIKDVSKYLTIQGILIGDVNINLGVEWGPVLPDVTDLSSFGQVLGNSNIWSWLQASAVTWQGTKPLELKTDFYLITLSKNQSPNIKLQAKYLAQLSSMYVKEGQKIGGTVHGGYTVDFAKNSAQVAYFNGGKDFDQSAIKKISDAKGTLTVTIGDQFTIDHLLLESVNITPSSVQVAPEIPLFIKVEANFRSNRAPLSEDFERIFGVDKQTVQGNPSPKENYECPVGTDSTYGPSYPASGIRS